jgi:hypothetical protein
MVVFCGARLGFLTNFSCEIEERGILLVTLAAKLGGPIYSVGCCRRGTTLLLSLLFLEEARRGIVRRRKI